MDPAHASNTKRRWWLFIQSGVAVALSSYALAQFHWTGTSELHTNMEVASALLAAIVGLLALARYKSDHSDGLMLLLAAGFLGTSALDGYHALVTSAPLAQHFPSALSRLIPWSWTASRLFLAGALLATWWTWKHKNQSQPRRMNVRRVAGIFTASTLACLLLFSFVPLPPATVQWGPIHRPGEFVPGVLFLITLLENLRATRWRAGAFHQWMVASLFLNVACELGYMPFSTVIFDGKFEVAHGLKLLSYACVFFGLLADVTEAFRDQALRAKTLTEFNQRLSAGNRDLDEFLFVASHDLQEPLRTARNFSQLLADEYAEQLDGDAKEYLSFIDQSTARMQDLLGDLLELSKVDRRPKPFEPCSLREAIVDVTGSLEAAMNDNGIALEVDAPFDEQRAHGDPKQIRLLLHHLIENAAKFRANDGPMIRVSTRNTLEGLAVSVEDNGIGIPAHQHERVTRLFQRLHGRESYPGTGVGLAICQKIVERHRGKMKIESEEGRGSTFTITLERSPMASGE